VTHSDSSNFPSKLLLNLFFFYAQGLKGRILFRFDSHQLPPPPPMCAKKKALFDEPMEEEKR
jgi:hypothetical protein